MNAVGVIVPNLGEVSSLHALLLCVKLLILMKELLHINILHAYKYSIFIMLDCALPICDKKSSFRHRSLLLPIGRLFRTNTKEMVRLPSFSSDQEYLPYTMFFLSFC